MLVIDRISHLANCYGFDDFYGDVGNVTGTGGKGEVAAPQMSAEEKAYLSEMTEIVKEQQRYNQMMQPIYAQQMGYRIEGDQWIRMTDAERRASMTESEQEQWDIAALTRERHRQALEGEIPLTEQMKQQKQQEFEALRDVTGMSGDTADNAVAEDTIGVKKLDAYKKRWNLLEEQQRHGQLGAGQQMNLAQSGLVQQQQMGQIGGLQGLGRGSAHDLQNYASLLQPYQAYNQMQYQASAATAANQAAQMGSLYQLGGTLGAATISDRRAKKNIKKKGKSDEDKALKELSNTPSYEFRYKDRMGLGPQKNLGSMADESPNAYVAPADRLMGQGAKEEDFYAFEEYMRQKYPGKSAPAASEEDFYEFEQMMKEQPGKSAPPASEEDFYAFEEEWRQKPGKPMKAIDLGNKMEHTLMGLKALARKVEKLEGRKRK